MGITKTRKQESMKATMTSTLESLKEWRSNIICDVTSDWIEDEEKELMEQQLEDLDRAISSLEKINISGGQVFNSSIPK